MEAATWNGPNIQRTSTRLGAAHGGVRALREAALARAGHGGPGARGEADGRAVRRAAGRRHDRRRRAGARAPRCIRLREARVERAARRRDPARRAGRDPRAARLRRRARPTTASTSSVPHWRRNDVTREADLVEEVGRIWGYEKLPTTLPSRRGVSGRLEPAQRLRRRAEDALIGAGLSEILGWSFAAPVARRAPADPGGRPAPPRRAARATRCPRTSRCCARRCSGRCSTTSQRNRARGHEDVRLWQYGAIYLARERRRRRRRQGRPQCPASTGCPTERAAPRRRCSPATCARRRGATPSRRARTSSPPRACSARCWTALRVPWEVEPAREPFLHPGRARARARRRRAGGLARRAASRRGGALGPRAGRGLRARLRRARRAAAASCRDYEDLTSFPAVRQDLAIVVPDDVSAAQVVAVVRKAGGALLRRAEVFDVYRGAQVGEGSRVARAAARVPRARPHADRRGGRRAAREDRRRAGASSSERGCVAERRRPRRVRLRRARSPRRCS